MLVLVLSVVEFWAIIVKLELQSPFTPWLVHHRPEELALPFRWKD